MARIARRPFVFSVLIGLVSVALGASGAKLYDTLAPGWLQAAMAGTVPFGVSDFGQPLPENHPFLQQGVNAPLTRINTAAVAPASSTDANPAATSYEAPLSLRQGCAWGEPGRAPYKGTIHQALNSARLPPDIVALLERKIHDHETIDVVEITNDQIRGTQSDAAFEPRAIKMTFAKTLCLNSRVNFKPGHVEGADLYEATDIHGVTYSVIVPYVCGNISVLGARGARADIAPILPGPGAFPPPGVFPSPGASSPQGAFRAPRPDASRTGGVPGIPSPLPFTTPTPLATAVPFTTPFDVNNVPEPETWTLMLGSFALLGWFTRRCERGSRRGDPSKSNASRRKGCQ